ncbi:MAG TPA: response regulator transcription factor [Planctomycetota bacterium]|jgi:two-component system OmpR family response regulator|nr:response regulator transcription factor [Planctomycetota bacterium]
MRVLLVEDERDLAAALRRALEEESFAVDVAHDGESGLFNAESWPYDAVVLDLMLPRLDGRRLLARLRETKATPVLVLTARDAPAEKAALLNAGADDYVTKPFELGELVARLRALIRRAAGKPAPVLRIGAVEIDTASRTVRRGGRPVDLTPKEYALAEFLALHRGELVTRTMIYDHLYDENDDTLSNVVDVYVSNLRRKLGKDFVETRRGQGYIVDA